MDRLDAMKVFVAGARRGQPCGRGAQARPLAGGGQPRHRLSGGAGRRRAAAPDNAVDQAERGWRALCRGLPPRAGRARGGRHHRGRRERSAPRGTLTLTAPVLSGEMVLRPILDAFLDAYPTVSARLYLLDRPVNLIDEGIDVALRIGPSRGFDDGRDPDRRSPPGGGRRAALPEAASAHRGASRSGQAPDHRDGAFCPIPGVFRLRRAPPCRERSSSRRGW